MKDDRLDLEEWDAEAPPSDFAARVLDRIGEEQPARVTTPRRWRRWLAIGAAATLATAAAMTLRIGGSPSRGEAIARDRTEVAMGSRAVAVLEPGASVTWNGDDVVQPIGDVFYRVERGGRFTVHTPAGDVDVKGTCFTVKVKPLGAHEQGVEMQKRDFKAAGIGAGVTALALVAVYEGKVTVSRASGRADLVAGQTAQAGPDGVRLTGAVAEGQKAFDAKIAAAESSDDPASKANQNLVRQVGEYRSRLEAITAQKAELETKLHRAEEMVAAQHDGAVPHHHDFDLSEEDWKELAKDSTVKFQIPCIRRPSEKPWAPSQDKLDLLGMQPQDREIIQSAYGRSNQRVWSALKPLCASAIGSPDVADKLGPETCMHLILDAENERDSKAADEAQQAVAEIRAGLRPMPDPKKEMNPVLAMFLAATGESKNLEADLAQSYGPDEAHRLIYSDELCMGANVFRRGPKPKK